MATKPIFNRVFICLLMILPASCIKASHPDLANLKFDERASDFLKGVAVTKTEQGRGVTNYNVTQPAQCTYNGLVIDNGLHLGAVNNIIGYYDMQTNLTATTNELLKHLLATYKTPTKLRDEGNTRAYYWITPTVFVRFMSDEGAHNGKKEVYSLVQVGNVKALEQFPDADITSAYNYLTGGGNKQTATQPQVPADGVSTKNEKGKQPSYHVFFRTAACHFMILVNDVPVITSTDDGSVSSEAPINQLILHSGPQTVSCVLLPQKGQTVISKDASISLKITQTDDNAPEQAEVTVAEFKPVAAGKSGQPQLRQSFQFKADVPYALRGWQDGLDLSHISTIHNDVVAAYQHVAALLKGKDLAGYEKFLAPKLRELEKATYTTEADSHKEFEEIVSYLSKPGVNIQFDAKTAKIVFYGNGKLVALVQPNLDPALHASNTKAHEDYQIALLFYKKSANDPLTLIR